MTAVNPGSQLGIVDVNDVDTWVVGGLPHGVQSFARLTTQP
ncbi:MAG: hypothetical protein ACJAZO_000400 [Myxococcota bacterium]|jgi:hypothetical protein